MTRSLTFACLMYHSLSDGRFPDRQYPRYTTTLALFTEHLRLLIQREFRLASLAELTRRLQSGERDASRYCGLTIDDGHKSALDLADAMAHAGVRATFFLTMGYCRERADFLKPDEIRGLANDGFDFGTHGVTHRALSRMPRDAMRAELRESKAWLEDILGRPVTAMSLPAGQGGRPVVAAATELGYALIGNSVEKVNHIRRLPSEVNRFVVLAGYSGEMVCRIAEGWPVYRTKRWLRSTLLALPKRLLQTYDETRA